MHAQAAPGRRLISPSAEAPARVAPGALLRFQVEAASGLTPPPGLQEDRAHRGFAVSLCARGLALGAPEQSCFPLAVRNVRPLDGASLGYRVEAPVPRWVAPSSYDLSVRFPGGGAELAAGVEVSEGPEPPRAAAEPTWDGTGFSVAAPADRPARLRIHVGSGGMQAHGARFDAYPLPDPARGFRDGFVALLTLAAGERAHVSARRGGVAPRLAIVAPVAQAGMPVTLRADADPGRVFWWIDADRGAHGSAVSTRFVLRGAAPIEALVVSEDGRSRRVRGRVAVVARRAFGCALAPHAPSGAPAGLLALVLGAGLGCRTMCRRRRSSCAVRGFWRRPRVWWKLGALRRRGSSRRSWE